MNSKYLIIILSLVISSCTSNGKDAQPDYKLMQVEQEAPQRYIHITGVIAEDRIKCSIENFAKEASYNYIIIGINYFTDTRELIRSDVYTIDKIVPPSSITEHTLAIYPPPLNYATIYISTRGASPAN